MKAVALASQLFSRLPAFELASLSEIMDIRADLATPLARFRAKMLQLASELKLEPWDDAFESEVENLVTTRISDEVLAINEAAASNRYMKVLTTVALGGELLRPAGAAVGTFLAAALTNQAGAASIAGTLAAGAAGVAAGAGALALQAKEKQDRTKEQYEANHLFFYVAVSDRLRSQ